jgi:hypothetical protein
MNGGSAIGTVMVISCELYSNLAINVIRLMVLGRLRFPSETVIVIFIGCVVHCNLMILRKEIRSEDNRFNLLIKNN